MPRKSHEIISEMSQISSEINKIGQAVNPLLENIDILYAAITTHEQKITDLFSLLNDHPGDLSQLKSASPFNMWCMQDRKVRMSVDDYFNQIIHYFMALRDYGFTAKKALLLTQEIKNFVNSVHSQRKKMIQLMQEADSTNDFNSEKSYAILDSNDYLLKNIFEVIVSADQICIELYASCKSIDIAMKDFVENHVLDETYLIKISQKLMNNPQIKSWCQPWIDNWYDKTNVPDPIRVALASLPDNMPVMNSQLHL